MRIYALYDELTGYQEHLTVMHNDAEALRNSAAPVHDPGSAVSLWHGDYSIWYIGDLDKKTGMITQDKPTLLARGSSLHKEKESKEK
ncbi:nonstructural protein [Sigmofec virus UA08Rod_5492]|uniref:Nonstructural protein n=1 Tax=Sigmofec virus UA08Rod_5492 TaxID=2929426 RepID=A0A976N148_9VIRU|nr:nonstructural protein [Sigmofec virus UA08Rod_5492]